MSGVSIGILVFPLIIRALVRSYGWWSSLLICGSISANICVCGMLMSQIPSNEIKQNQVAKSAPSTVNVDAEKKTCQSLKFIFSNSEFLIFIFSNFFIFLGLAVVYVHLSAFALYDVGLNEDDGAVLFSMIGVANFVGRIFFGVLTHYLPRSSSLFYGFAMVVSACLILLLFKVTTFAVLLCCVLFFGFFTSVLGVLTPTILIEILNCDSTMLSVCYAIILIFNAVSTMTGSVVAGKLLIIYANC